jgi:hypothetical protein
MENPDEEPKEEAKPKEKPIVQGTGLSDLEDNDEILGLENIGLKDKNRTKNPKAKAKNVVKKKENAKNPKKVSRFDGKNRESGYK